MLGHISPCLSITGSAEAIYVDFVKRNLISLIVITTHGKSGISHLLLGSVAEKVVREGSEFSSVLIERCKKC
ncbi:MAG: universal stress protein [Proteobacteria bacterium]|nr:universal stress protein [Pseudomonadota bacterium]